jgi:DNA-binding XRE family transcriptional regulator
MTPLDVLIARGIRRVRMERGWSMRDAAEMLSVNISTVSRIENGERRISRMWDTRTVASRLGVGVGYLLCAYPQCRYQPPSGYLCLRCGSSGEPVPAGRGTEAPVWVLAWRARMLGRTSTSRALDLVAEERGSVCESRVSE